MTGHQLDGRIIVIHYDHILAREIQVYQRRVELACEFIEPYP